MSLNPKLLSLKWKALIWLTLLLALVNGGLGYVSYRSLEQQLQYQLDLATRRSINNVHFLVDQNNRKLQALAEGIFESAQQQMRGNETLVEFIDRFWDTLHEKWELETIALFDEKNALVMGWGNGSHNNSIFELASQTHKKNQISSTFHCAHSNHNNNCVLLTAVPLQSQQIVVMSIPVANLITDFFKDNFLNFALLSSEQNEESPELTIAPWHFQLMVSTDLAGNLALLQSAASTVPFAQLQKTGGEFEDAEGKYFHVHAMPMETLDNEEDVLILLIDDITAQREALNTRATQTVLMAALGMLLSEVALLLLLWGPLERIKWQAGTLPLLADGDYESVYTWSGNRNIKHRDELDVLEEASITLATRLEKMSVEIRRRSRELEYLAFYDPLTGLPNRRMFVERIERAIAAHAQTQQGFAILLIDLDNFKRINDSMGHDVGDDLLVEIAHRLKAIIRSGDMVARLGGDEFIVLLENAGSEQQAANTIDQILLALYQPLYLRHKQMSITGSLGVALAPQHGLDASELMKHADMAMYRAKSLGRNTYQVFTEEIDEAASKLLDLEQELKVALDSQQFELVYQPIVSFPDRAVVGLETLVRWQHPERGTISPIEFIPIMESNGSIVGLDRYVVHVACRDLRWLQQELRMPLMLSINLSTHQLRDATFVDFLRDEIAAARIEAQYIKLEVTESALMEDIEHSIMVLNELKALGVKLSIDDFGTGYSSLNYLRKLPVDELKVDRSFVTDIPNHTAGMEITAAVIAMAHKLQLVVVAEGIEEEAQVEFLFNCQCDYGQGYLFHRPANRTTISEWIRAQDQIEYPRLVQAS